MEQRLMRAVVSGLLLCLFAMCNGCRTGINSGQCGYQRINAGGSTFVYPMMSRWASEYDKQTGSKVNYQSVGSGGGIQQMTVMTFDYGCTDAPMNEEQLEKARKTGGEVVHIPLVM